jgi:hypothetical protein
VFTAVCAWNDHGTCFSWHRLVCYHGIFIQDISEEVWQRQDQIDAVLESADIVEAGEAGHSSIIRKVLDKVKSEITK